MERVNFQAIENKWQKKFSNFKLSKPGGKKFYCLEMFLSSGKIQYGHVRNYTIGDVIARYKYLNGLTCSILWVGTLYYLRKRLKQNNSSKEWTYKILYNENQLKLLGLSIDWDLK